MSVSYLKARPVSLVKSTANYRHPLRRVAVGGVMYRKRVAYAKLGNTLARLTTLDYVPRHSA